MLLAVDIGNTNIVIGIFKDNQIINKFRINTDKNLNSEEYFIQIKNILHTYNINIKQIKNCAICSVVPTVLPVFKQAIKYLINKEPFVVKYDVETGINLLIDNPEKLGNDLLVSAVEALNQFKPPFIIIDMGTATTFSIIDKNKNYLGGLIAPGVKISLDALCQKAQQIPEINLDKPKNLIGKNTVECVQSGIIYGSAVFIDGMIEMLQEEIGEKATIIITGGLSKQVIPFCKSDMIYEEDLVLKGINTIFLKNLN